MKKFEFEHIELDMCEKCHGVWFDKDEFPAILKILENDPVSPYAKFNPFHRKTRVIDPKSYLRRICPRCQSIMDGFNYVYDSNIFLDKCPTCGGVWADKGEVLKAAIYNKGYPKLEAIGRAMLEEADNVKTAKELSEVADSLTQYAYVLPAIPIILPVSSENLRSRIPYMNISIIFVNVVAFIYEFIAIVHHDKDLTNLVVVPSVIMAGKNLYSLVTSVFLHGGGAHLFFNMFFLWLFGNNVEDYLGSFKYLILYLLFGLCGSLLFVATSINTPLASEGALGASGAVSGVMAAYFALFPKSKINVFIFNRIIATPAFLYIGFFILTQIVFVALKSVTGYEAVGYSAHLGGIISALIVVFFIKKYRAYRARKAVDSEDLELQEKFQ